MSEVQEFIEMECCKIEMLRLTRFLDYLEVSWTTWREQLPPQIPQPIHMLRAIVILARAVRCDGFNRMLGMERIRRWKSKIIRSSDLNSDLF